MKIPLMDLKKQYKKIRKEVLSEIKKILDKQSFILGEETEELERNMASYCGTKYAVGVNSGTDALFLSLLALGISNGDEVITTPFTFFATVEAIVNAGAKPVFVDIDRGTYNIDPKKIGEKITNRTKAIMPVHLYGQCAEMEIISKIAKERKLKVIEDAAQAIGAERNGKKSGSLGDIGAFSFYPGKNLGCFGDGGIITTNEKDLYDRLKLLRNHGSSPKNKYDNELTKESSKEVYLIRLKYSKQ